MAVGEALVILDAILSTIAAQLAKGIKIRPTARRTNRTQARRSARCAASRSRTWCGEVACSICGSPHHADCWDFNGGCSVFGCTGSAPSPRRKPAG